MDSFIQRAKERIQQLTKKIGKDDATTSHSTNLSSSIGGAGAGGNSSVESSSNNNDRRSSTGSTSQQTPSGKSSHHKDPVTPPAPPFPAAVGGGQLDGSQGGTPAANNNNNKTSIRRKAKDHTIHVHPLLDKEFEDNITPPRSPAGRGGGATMPTSVKSPALSGRQQQQQQQQQQAGKQPATTGVPRSVSPHHVNINSNSAAGCTSPSSDLSRSSSTQEGSTPKNKQSSSGGFDSSHNSQQHLSSALLAALLSKTVEFNEVLSIDPVDMKRLRRLCWSGCVPELRMQAWSLLTGYHPPQHVACVEVVKRKRIEYASYLRRSYNDVDWSSLIDPAPFGGSGAATSARSALSSSSSTVGAEEVSIMKQIRKDVPRSSGGVAFLQHPRVMQTLERVLFVWALRHPACGYVQGMNDLILPFLYVTIAAKFMQTKNPADLSHASEAEAERLFDGKACSNDEWLAMEADLYWVSATLLNGIQENFTYNQAGVHAMVRKLEAVVRASDPQLANHLETLGIPFNQFAFRWMNCLLIREFSMSQALRLWDTYLSEENVDLSTLHVFVCASLLTRWSAQICQEDDFSAVMTFLQNPPTSQYNERDMDELISEGFLKQQLYGNCNSLRKA